MQQRLHWYDYSNTISRGVNPNKLLVLQVCPPSCCLRLLGPSAPFSASSPPTPIAYRTYLVGTVHRWLQSTCYYFQCLVLSVESMEIEKLLSVICCISSSETKTDLVITRWDGIPTFRVVCMDLLRSLKLRRWFFQYYYSAKLAIKNKTSFTYYNWKIENRFQIKTDGSCTENWWQYGEVHCNEDGVRCNPGRRRKIWIQM